MANQETVLVVGTGLAGVTAAGELREQGFDGRIVLIGDEPEYPYDRPPLSKSALVDDDLDTLVDMQATTPDPQQIALRPRDWYEAQAIELMLGCAVTELDTGSHHVELSDGQSLSYDRLLLVPGSRARRLPSLESGPVPSIYLRHLGDSLRLREALSPEQRVVLIGGGVIGLEVAASAVTRGCDVTVIELAPRVMSRALCPSVAERVADYHRQKGVTILTESLVSAQTETGPTGVQLKDGAVIPADLIVIGIGIEPNTEIARDAGIACDDGILVDEFGQTSVPGIYAAGDVAKYPDRWFGETLRSENWMHAQYHAQTVARNMLGAKEPYARIPFMWSDQYDLKIQTTGVCYGNAEVIRGDPDSLKYVIFHTVDGRVRGASGVNMPRDIKFTQALIESGATVADEDLANPKFNLKKAARAVG